MKRLSIVLLFTLIVALLAFAPRVEDPIDRFVTSLQRWTDTNPQEKVYLHMDKPYYAIGDTIWFKAYVTMGSRHQLSKMSGALYVELIDEKDSLLNSIKLPVIAGMAMGNFTLGDEYKEGNFRIRAYTRWMRNAGEDYFFDRTFAVGDPLGIAGQGDGKSVSKAQAKNKAKTAAAPQDSLSKSDVQFFPEGGNMVSGINSRIGFKAVGVNGRGISLKGTVTDNTGNEITSFESLHAGMGVFNIRPEAGKRYKAKLSFTDGSERTVELPATVGQGYTLAVYQPNADSILVRIHASPDLYQAPQSVSLLVQSGGETIFASPIKISKVMTSVWLLKEDFPTGIAQFTIFDGRGEPLNERIAFIRSNDAMQLEITSAKNSYSSREKVVLDLESKDQSGNAVAGNFSVSVIDESKVPNDETNENTILSGLLLRADLKGYIEQPNYYFINETKEVNKALDNLMLTQGYRRFTWKEILSITSAQNKPLYKAESLGTEISGRVLTLSGKPVVNGEVTLMSLAQGFMEKAKTDADGRFRYEPIMLADSIRFAVQARTDRNGKNVEVVLDEIPGQAMGGNKNKPDFNNNITESTKTYLENSKKQDDALTKTGRLSRANRLKEVNITARRSQKLTYAAQGGLRIPDDHADFTYIMKDGDKCATLGICLQGKLGQISFVPFKDPKSGITIQSYPHSQGKPVMVIVDGMRITEGIEIAEIFDQNVLDPEQIVKIDVVRTNEALKSILGGSAILIYTKRGRAQKPRYTPSMANAKPKGFNKAREFYSPRYDMPGISHQLPDLRSTIYWNPKVKTFANGRGSFSFFNADGPGTYKVIVEGINAAGELGRLVYRYEVEAGTQAQLPETTIDNTNGVVKAMEELRQRLPAEKLYVQTDKPYYNLGDTIWFKAYLFDAASLSASKRSGLLYVELNSDTAEAVRRISIPIKDGVGYAQIALTKKIFREGGYTFRAYTNWMRNFGDNYFFTRRFYLGVPTHDTWLVRSSSRISKVTGKDQLQTDLFLNRQDQSAVGLKNVEMRVMEGDKQLYTERLQTSAAGKLAVNYNLGEKADGRRIRLEVRSIDANDGNQRLLVPINVVRNQNLDLQFLPEGGVLVAGLKSVVGFKAIGENGKGVHATGALYDSQNNQVASFTSLYNGMGSFEFTPKQGETYTAKLEQPEAVAQTFALPAIAPTGTVLNLINREQSDSVTVNIQASVGTMQPNNIWYLIATSRGLVTYTQQIDPKINSYKIAKSVFPDGITQFTIFRDKTQLNQRIVFIDHRDPLQIVLSTDKSSYYERDSVALVIEVKDKNGAPVEGNFSIAVTDNSQVTPDSLGNYGIESRLLLTSELKGTIETPGYYLSRNNKESWQALDNLLLTQGWTGYDWKTAFGVAKTPEFEPDPYLKIKGTVVNVLNKPIAGAQMLLSSQKPAFITQTLSDAEGKYVFEKFPKIDSGSFFIQARTPRGRTMNFGAVTLEKFKAPAVPENFRDPILPWYVNSDAVRLNYVKTMAVREDERNLKLTGNLLKQVNIKERKVIKESYHKGGADLVFDEADIKQSGVIDLYELLRQKLPGFRVVMKRGFPAVLFNNHFITISIDGNGLPFQIGPFPSVDEVITEMKEYKIASYVGLQVMYSRKYTYSYFGPPRVPQFVRGVTAAKTRGYADQMAEGFPGSVSYTTPGQQSYTDWRVSLEKGDPDVAKIEITTRNKSGWLRNNRPDYATYRPLPVMRPQEFYSPRYTIAAKDNAEPDYRSTIYWKPDVITDANGRATVSFYTADITGTYSINLQGSDMDGNIGSAASSVKVGQRAQ